MLKQTTQSLAVLAAVAAVSCASAPTKPAVSAPASAPPSVCAIPSLVRPPEVLPANHGFSDSVLVSLVAPANEADGGELFYKLWPLSDPPAERRWTSDWIPYQRPFVLSQSTWVSSAYRATPGAKSASTAPVLFEDLDARPWEPLDATGVTSARLGIVSAPAITAAAFDFGVSILADKHDVIGKHFVIDVDVPLGVGLGLDDTLTAAQRASLRLPPAPACSGATIVQPIFGNPSAGLRLVTGNSPVRLAGGLHLVAPVNAGSPGCGAAPAIGVLELGGAGYDLWRYAGGYFPIVLPASIDLLTSSVHGRLEGEAELFIPLFSRATLGQPAQLALQWAAEVEWRTSFSGARFFLGARLQGAHIVTSNASLDSFTSSLASPSHRDGARQQLALEPFLGIDTRAVWMRLGVLTPLDQPLGFGFDHAGIYTVRFTLGRRL